MDTPSRGRAAAEAQLKLADAKLAYLARLDPLLIASVREACFASVIGATLQNKIDLLALIDQFGVTDKIIATLDYAFGDYPEVEDDFCLHLKNTGYDLRHCFAMTEVGTFDAAGAFEPDISMCKLVDYAIPNTLHEINLLPLPDDPALAARRIAASVAWLRARLCNVDGAPCRIYLNIVDLMDTFMLDSAYACTILEQLAKLELDALSFEDGRGTYFPFQVGAVVGAARALLRPDQQVLFHAHTGAGMENASVIEALLQGADGYWGGMERTSSTIGHASIGDLVANLLRTKNANLARRFHLERLLPVCQQSYTINNGQALPPDDWPINGADAYRTVLSDFAQTPLRPMDLPPEVIGGTYRYRIAPVGSDIIVVQNRVHEALGFSIDDDVARDMILLMRSDLRANLRIVYDEPDQLRELHRRAVGGCQR